MGGTLDSNALDGNALDDAGRAEVARQTERWFVRRGIPHFIDGYSATSDIFTRAAGFLYVVFVLDVLNGLNDDWPGWANLLAFVGSVAIVFGSLAVLNLRRGEPWYRRPRTIGPVELAGFVIVPSIIPLVFGGQVGSAIATTVGSIVLLGVVYVVVSYGILPMVRWAFGQTLHQVRNLFNLMVRSLPLLLIFTMFMFLNAELWKVAAETPPAYFVVALLLLIGLGSLFLLLRLPAELSDVSRLERWSEVHELAAGSPVAAIDLDGLDDPPAPPPLGRRARANVGLVLYFAQAIQIFLVSVAIGGFYFLFGLFTVGESTIELWTGEQDLEPWAVWQFLGNEMAITGALVRSALFVAGISGLQFTVSALTDRSYREEFVSDVIHEFRESFAVRAIYLAKLVDRDPD